MKIILVILLAKITKKYNDKMLIRTFQTELSYLLQVLKYVIPPVLFTYLQNDTGVVMIMLVGVFFVVFSSGLRKEWFLIIFGVVGLIIIIGTYLFLYQHDIFTTIVTGHKLDRLYGWIDPEGTVSNQGMQLFYALISYGSAGLTGHGFQATIKTFPEAQTDFIFAVILTDYGFIGGLITVLLVIALDVTILKIGLDSSNSRDKYFAMGIFGLLLFQQVWNMGMILGLLPITGITLPLISYGGSSLLSYMLTVGMFLDINHQSNIIKNKLS
jgi:rod shape determining protein RodA